ncbi:MAG: translation initiation factor IF-2, partial [Clostridia bacterium]|nr:translation initiation factor IF-2 [Clostridia bacterium]
NRKMKKKAKEEPVVIASPIDHAIITTANLTVKQLSEKTGRSVAEILKQLMVLGIMSNLNSTIDFTTAELVCSELGVVLEQKLEKTYEEKLADEFMNLDDDADSADNIKRSPIVTILGHVDHGKTSLLDYIRKSHIASGEAGGITQHISAYQIEKNGEPITFIDTPGHEAFSAMRARGASVTDIAILVVAADDGVKPQTKEAIKHIKEAKVPMIVAINKIDKPEANIDRVKEQLAKEDVIPEEWGGDAIIVPISALTGQGVDKLLEMIILVADMQELKANPKRHALGMVIEAKLDKGKGPIATLIILNGTLKVGDTIISGTHVGKVRAILDDKGKNIKSAPPSKPVSILGLDGVPNAGDQLYVVDEKMSKHVLAERKRKQQTDLINAKSKMSVEEFLAKNIEDEKKVLYLIVKTDVQGSFEALTAILNEINNEEVRVECTHGGVGAITENDVILAKSSGAILVAFNVKPDSKASALAEQNKIEIMQSKIIYQITEEVSRRIKAMRAPVFEERVIGHCEVIRVFKISRIGTVAGCICKDGKINKNVKIRLFREGKQLVETTITTLQKDKMDVKEVSANMECGIKLDGHNDIILGDILEAFVMEQIERD